MKREFNEVELSCIEALLRRCGMSSYVFAGSMLEVRFENGGYLSLNSKYLQQLIAQGSFVCVKSERGALVLTIIAE